MQVFTPPVEMYVPPVPAGVNRDPPWRLFQYFGPGPRGVNVFKMADGSYLRDDVTGVWPTTDVVANNAIAWTWGIGSGNTYPNGVTYPMFIETPFDNPVLYVYYGGHSYVVADDEADRLTNAGFGPNISGTTYGMGAYGTDVYGD